MQKKYKKNPKKGVKNMAVMTSSQNSVFIINSNKKSEFIKTREANSNKVDYSIIVKQASQIEKQIVKQQEKDNEQ